MIRKNVLFIALAALLLSACTENQILSSVGAVSTATKGLTISKEELIAESKLSAKELDSKNPIAPANNAYAKRLNKLTKNLQTYDGLNLNYSVYLVKDINAFAMPDGTVRVFAGLMDMMTDDELLAVIGHEIGHVANEHSLNQYKKAYLVKASREGLEASGGVMGKVAGAYGEIGESFLNAQFSQADELSSDEYGVKVLKALGRDPYAAMAAQQKMQALGGGSNGLFSSHPPSKKRIENARKAADKISKQ